MGSKAVIGSRFALYNFSGRPTAWFGVEEVDLGSQSKATVKKMLSAAGLSAAESDEFWSALAGDALMDSITKVAKAIDKHIDAIYSEVVRPLVFYIGSTGLVPDGLPVLTMTADQLVTKYPKLTPGKAEKEGTFFALPNDVIIGVYTKQEYFSTPAGVENAA